ncbi:hypothetical protein [Rhodovulum visakhapatnamense]|uniref:Uncharacterized protein n=1 Tax=Rhodovulum visakhapatnamense TaxID=364297 RepID=A0A4V3GTU4_9RHOB|nr:hypothetical protein [Rhodovulum visakhapatnamense]TDX28177.1 hypothetical protein EV657_1123 [Rhodovulum visakhapatnamense]
MNETYYGTPPGERLGLLKGWLDAARGGDVHLRQVLGNPAFYAPSRDDRRRVCFRRSWAYPPVPYLADRFCMVFLGCRVWEWIGGKAPEPVEIGEVVTAEGGGTNPPSYSETGATYPGADKVYLRRDAKAFLDNLKAIRRAVYAETPMPTNLPREIAERYLREWLERPRIWKARRAGNPPSYSETRPT